MTDGALTLVGLVLTCMGLLYTAEQIRRARNVSQAEFLLRLDEQFREHLDVHIKLRPGGDWHKQGYGPETREDWVAVEMYMGLFERIYVLVDSKIISQEIINHLYGYRLTNIVKNDIIREGKLENPATKSGWSDFIKLVDLLDRWPK